MAGQSMERLSWCRPLTTCGGQQISRECQIWNPARMFEDIAEDIRDTLGTKTTKMPAFHSVNKEDAHEPKNLELNSTVPSSMMIALSGRWLTHHTKEV